MKMSVEPVLVANALTIILRPLLKKARSSLVGKLREGDLNSQMVGNLIVTSLNDIKTKLDGLADSVLQSSLSFTQEGLRSLAVWLRPQDNQASTSGGESHDNVDPALKLAEHFKTVKIQSSDHFESAMKSFENANNEATKAFHNKALSLENRILAAKLRVQSRLLLSLRNPSLATAPCKLYLEELHTSIPSLAEVFRTYFRGGLFALLNQKKRSEIVSSVTVINLVVFTFLKSFTKDPVSLLDWPSLELEGRYNPLIPSEQILMELQNAGIKFPNLIVLKNVGFRKKFQSVAVNKDGDLIVGPTESKRDFHLLKVSINEFSVWRLWPTGTVDCQSEHLFHLANDRDDNVYMLTDECDFKDSPSMLPSLCELKALDSKGNVIQQFELGDTWSNKVMTSAPDGFVVCTLQDGVTRVTFFKMDNGKIQCDSSCEIRQWKFSLCTITDQYQVITAGESGKPIRVYNKDGELQKEFELYNGEHEFCCGITFNYLTKEIVIVSGFEGDYFLSTYLLETGRRCHCVKLSLLGKCENKGKKLLVSNSSGVIFLVTDKYILNIQ